MTCLKIGGDTGYTIKDNRDFCKEYGIETSYSFDEHGWREVSGLEANYGIMVGLFEIRRHQLNYN